MDCGGIREENDAVTGFSYPVTQVDVFPVHKESGIQQTDLFDHLVPDNDKPAVEHFHWHGSLVIKVGHQQASPKAGVREDQIEAESSGEAIPYGWESHGRAADGTVGRQHLRPNHRDLRIFGKVFGQGRDAIVGKDYVGIYKADVITRTLRDTDVVCFGKAVILGIANELEVGIQLRYKLRRAVGRGVIDDDYFSADAAAVFLQ